MAGLSTIQLHTLLGEELEDVFSRVLDLAGITFSRSDKSLSEFLHEPDFVFEWNKRTYVFQVTNTLQAETFIKKRWRYIEQLAQTKAVLGADVVCASVIFGPAANLQSAEIVMADFLFDGVAWCQRDWNSTAIEDELKRFISRRGKRPKSGDLSKRAQDKLDEFISLSSARLLDFLVDAENWLTTSLLNPLWNFENAQFAARESALRASRQLESSNSYLRRTFFKLVCIDDSNVKTVLASTQKTHQWSDELVAEAEFAGIEFRKAIGGRYRVTDSEIVPTQRRGYDHEMHATLSSALVKETKYKQLIRDVRSLQMHVKTSEVVLDVLKDSSPVRLSSLVTDAFNNPSILGVESERVWPVDVVLAIIGMSASELNRRYVDDHGHRGVSNPVKNFIVRTDQAVNGFEDQGVLKRFSSELSALLWNILPQDLPEAQVVAAELRRLRRAALFLQPYLNPTRLLFENAVGELGWSVEVVSLPSALGLAAVPGRMKKVEQLYKCGRGNETRVAKVIAAYEEGVGHKATEMSGRRRMLGFVERDGELVRADLDETHFVYEGAWPPKYREWLILAGWDNVYSLWDVQDKWS